MEDKSPELGGPLGQSGAPLQIQSIPIRRQRPVPTFFAVTNCHHGDHHKKDSSQMQSFPGKFLTLSPSLPLGLHALLPLTSVPWFLEGVRGVFKKSGTEAGLGPETGWPSSPQAPGPARGCHAPVQTIGRTGKPGRRPFLPSLSVEWLPPLLSPSPPRAPRQACEGRPLAGVGRGSGEGLSNEGLGYPWEGSRSSQESCLYVCFLN